MPTPQIAEGYPRYSTVPGEFPNATGPVDLLSTAVRLGSLAWTEGRLHGIVGGWSRDAEGEDFVVLFDRLAMDHAARTALVRDRLPRLRELPRETLLVSPGEATDTLLDQLVAVAGDDARAAAWANVASTLADAYAGHLARCTPVADTPLLRRLPALVDRLRSDASAVTARAVAGGATADPPSALVAGLVDTAGFTA